MARTPGDLTRIVGRERERAVLLEMLEEGGPLVAFIHAPAGMGKSTLLTAFASDAARAGARVVRMDCRTFEPTERGFLDALGRVLEARFDDAPAAGSALRELGTQVVMLLDTYEVFRISDAWLRSDFVPMLDPNIKLAIAGREPPLAAWFDARGLPDTFRSIMLGPLDESDAIGIMQRAGVTVPGARSINRIARGHPLALQVAAAALQERPEVRVEEAAIPRLVEELTKLYLDNLDETTRRVLDCASVVRRANAPLLSAMLPEVGVSEALDRLAGLPFVEEGTDGLRLHETVQAAVSARLLSRDPEAHRRYRAMAWQTLRRRTAETTRSELWRQTADMLYLIENPAVREAFFPTTAHLYAVEPARPTDESAIREIVELHEPPESASVLAEWWTVSPEAFRVVRDRTDAVAGVLMVIEADRVPYKLVRIDPVIASWREHLKAHPLPVGQKALFDRLDLSRDDGGDPGPVQAATWLDIKRIYMEMRPHLGRLYSLSADPAPYVDALDVLGFDLLEKPVHLGRDYFTACLTFGPDSVDGWLTRLAASELGVRPEELLDPDSRELVLDGQRVPLSPLEFGVLQCLLTRKGTAVSRATLIEEVWGHAHVGSNVVDVVVRSLRKKLGPKASALETVRGVGYRFTP